GRPGSRSSEGPAERSCLPAQAPKPAWSTREPFAATLRWRAERRQVEAAAVSTWLAVARHSKRPAFAAAQGRRHRMLAPRTIPLSAKPFAPEPGRSAASLSGSAEEQVRPA